jgi:hypothetical protein
MFAVGGGANLSDIVKAINAIGATSSGPGRDPRGAETGRRLRAELVIL